jgi:hypothetical protein
MAAAVTPYTPTTSAVDRYRSASESERYEICELGVRGGRSRARVLATAGSLAGARLALRTLTEEFGGEPARLEIRDTATGHWRSA